MLRRLPQPKLRRNRCGILSGMADFESLEKQIDTLAQIMVREFKDVHEEINEVKTDVVILKTDMEIVKEKIGGVPRRIDEEVEQRHQLGTHVSKLEEKIA